MTNISNICLMTQGLSNIPTIMKKSNFMKKAVEACLKYQSKSELSESRFI